MDRIDTPLPGMIAERDAMLNGLIDGALQVAPGVHVVMNGMVSGDLVARAGSAVEVNGVVMGQVINEGARVDIHGVVRGVRDIGAETSRIHAGAVIDGRG